MPVITFEEFKELSRDKVFLDGLHGNILVLMNNVKKTDENPERIGRFRYYLNAIQALSDPDASEDTIRKNLNILDGFKEFLEKKDINDESNFDKLKKDFPSYFDLVLLYIENASKSLGLQIGYKLQKVSLQTEVKEDNHEIAPVNITADKYIEKIRDNEFKEFNPNRLNDVELDKFADRILHIMAARQLANSDRGKVAKLKAAVLDPADIDERVDEMREDPAFQSFIAKIKYDPDSYKKAFLAGQATPGHGGKLDDMFKEHMLNLPPGFMPNTKLHERYLPTAKARIESIQKQVENRDRFIREYERAEANYLNAEGDHLKTRYYEWLRNSLEEYTNSLKRLEIPVCEVVALRNMVHAEHGKKETLDKKIPAFEEDTLKRDATQITDSSVEHTYISNHSATVRGLLLKGHGGDMTEDFRSYVDRVDVKERTPGLREFALANTILTREEELKIKAKSLSASIKKETDAEKKKELMDEGKVLIAEYLILCAKATNPKTGKTSVFLQFKDCPWGKINELHKNGVEFSDESFNNIKKFNEKDLTDLLDKMQKQDMDRMVGPIQSTMYTASRRKPVVEAKAGNNGPKIGK